MKNLQHQWIFPFHKRFIRLLSCFLLASIVPWRTFNIHGNFSVHKIFLIVEKVQYIIKMFFTRSNTLIIKINALLASIWFHEEPSISIEPFHSTKGFIRLLQCSSHIPIYTFKTKGSLSMVSWRNFNIREPFHSTKGFFYSGRSKMFNPAKLAKMFFGEPKKYSSMESLWKTPFGTFKYIMGIWVLDLWSVLLCESIARTLSYTKQTNKQTKIQQMHCHLHSIKCFCYDAILICISCKSCEHLFMIS